MPSPSTAQKLFAWCLLAYLAILPMSNTIALRNLLLLVLVVSVIFSLAFRRERLAVSIDPAWRQLPWPLVVWVVFLCLFPLWAVQPDVAWHNLRGQWGESILAWVVGLGAVLLLGRHGPGLWALAWASAFPVLVHLFLCLLAWAGLLGGGHLPDDMPIERVGAQLLQVFTVSGMTGWSWQPFPWGFRGLEPMHGNLGYTACQAIALLGVCFYFSWRRHLQLRMWGATLGITLCLLSILIANSRGALIFGLMLLGLTALTAFLKYRGRAAPRSGHENPWPRRAVYGAVFLLLSGLIMWATSQSMRHDIRWHTMIDKVTTGLLIEEPAEVLCDGVSIELEAQIRARFSDRPPAYAEAVLYGLRIQDGGRIMLMRTGFELMLEHPRGLDGSRYSYQKLIEQKCGHAPVLKFAHLHQGWMDTALTLGLAGAVALAVLMISLMLAGWRRMRDPDMRAWAFALFLISAFWLLRAFADSVFREHFLQMQAVLLAYLFWRMKLAPESRQDVPSA